MIWLRRALAVAADGRQKAIAAAAFPGMSDAAALAELGKYLNGERGESALRVVESVIRLGRRETLRAEFDERLRELSVTQLVDDMCQIQVQLELFGARVLTMAKRVEEVAEALPLKRPG